MAKPTPPSKDATQHDQAAPTPAPGAAATDIGRTLIQSPGSQFSAFLGPPQAADELGRLGGFRILRLIGQGGMGFVFEGQDLRLERRVAIKVMRSEVAAQPEAVGRFLREAKTAAALSSDHVVTIHHVDEQNGVPFLVMPLMAGETLHDRMHREPLDISEAIRIGRECALGLAAAHAAGLIHRDIKPANLWLEGTTARVKVLDFGLARAVSGSDITRSGQVLGTPQYMAPEQARGRVVDARADLFSLGAVLYRLTTGREAFSGDDVLAVLTSLAVDDPKPPRTVNPDVPSALSSLIMRLLSKDVSRRPASAAEVAAALRKLETGADTTAVIPPPSRLLTAGTPSSRRRRWLIAAPAAVIGGVLLALLARIPFGAPAASSKPEPVSNHVPVTNDRPLKIPPTTVPKLIASTPATVRLKTGGATVFVVSVQREHVAGAVKLEWLDLPAGIRAGGATLIPAVSDRTQVTLAADYSARGPGLARLRASVGDTVDPKAIEFTIERVAPPLLDSTRGPLAGDTVKLIQQQWADYLGKPLVETVKLGEDAVMEFVLIPPGEFMMGSTPDDRDAYPDEQPKHKRRVTKPYYLGRTAVTGQQFIEFVKAMNYKTEAEASGEGGSGLDVGANQLVARNPKFSWRDNGFLQHADHPVVNVTHKDALRFCDWLSAQQRIGKAHLPSEAQWEYACRAGGTSRYISGDEPDSLRGFANVSDQSLRAKNLKGTERWRYFAFDDDSAFTSPVGSYRGNGFALRDMTGNVWQWCADSFEGGAYKSPPADERAWVGGDGKERVVRGGSWNNNARDTRSASRDRNEANDRQSNVGFRVALRFE